MKTINAKRIAAVAASLLMGLAFAGSGGVTWSNIPIINNQGQPVVQVVVGSTAQPSDGVVAANIAAVLGNLAFTSQNVTATPTGLGNVNCVVTTPTCTLSNQQVWFGVKGFTGPSGSYSFTALIGSVLNGGVQLSSPQSTKALQASATYAFPVTYGSNGFATQLSPVASPFSITSAPVPRTVSTNVGGGAYFLSFRTGNYDNLLQVTPAQLPGLVNNWGTYGETENLWLTGFPVYDQQVSTNPTTPSLAVFDAGGAYQVTFNKPIPEPYVQKGNTINNAAIEFLGKNWTILNYTQPSGSVSNANAIHGGKLSLAATLTPVQTVYVGHNISSDGFTVQLTDLGQPTSSAISAAAVQVYYNGTLTNTTQLNPGTTTKFTTSGHSIYVNVNQTFAGLYAYQKWAKLKLYSNLVNITDNTQLNTTNAPGWNTYILWTNGTTSSGKANELWSIIAYNVSPQVMLPGGSLSFIAPNMTAWKESFIGDTLGTNFDPVQFSLSSQSGLWLQNKGTVAAGTGQGNINNLTQQAGQMLTVSSQINSAFSYAGQTGSTVTYDLTPYQLNLPANSIAFAGATPAGASIIIQSTIGDANIINPKNPLTVTVTGYSASPAASGQLTTASAQVYALSPSVNPGGTILVAANVLSLSSGFYNVTNVYMSQALPDLTVNVIPTSSSGNVLPTNSIAAYVPYTAGSAILYKSGAPQYYQLTSGSAVTYNQQNGQPAYNNGFSLASVGTGPQNSAKEYYTYTVTEYPVSGSTTYTDTLAFGIYNSTTGGAQNFGFQLNQSTTGTRNNMTYTSATANVVQAPTGFITERGTKVASISPQSATINIAKAVDTLQFVISPSSTSLANASTSATVGPVGVGQAVPGFANLTVSKVNATCGGVTVSSSSCTVSGLSNVTATPSVTQAVVPVSLNTATTPLVVLDSNANSAATLVLVGSKFVNSVSAQVFAQNPALNSSFGPSSVIVQAYGTNRILVAGYTANQTVQAGNQFINDLLQASSSV